jgi:hypothetical protein
MVGGIARTVDQALKSAVEAMGGRKVKASRQYYEGVALRLGQSAGGNDY